MSKIDTIISNLRLQADRLESIKDRIEDELQGDWISDIDEAVDEVEYKITNAEEELNSRDAEAEAAAKEEEEEQEDDEDFL